MRARYYDPGAAQFLSRDPAIALTQSAHGYVDGSPLNDIDPTGLCPWGMGELCNVVKHEVAPAAGGVGGFISDHSDGIQQGSWARASPPALWRSPWHGWR